MSKRPPERQRGRSSKRTRSSCTRVPNSSEKNAPTGPYIADQATRATQKAREIKTGFPVSTSQNIGKVHSPTKPVLKSAKFLLPTLSEIVAKNSIPIPMNTTAIMTQYSMVDWDNLSCVTS